MEPIRLGGFFLDFEDGIFQYQGKPIHLTPHEFGLAHSLMEAKGRLITKLHMWQNYKGPGVDVDTEPKIVDVLICKVRRKIKAATGLEPIGTVWGRGYFWQVAN